MNKADMHTNRKTPLRAGINLNKRRSAPIARARKTDKSIVALNQFSALLWIPIDPETHELIGSAPEDFWIAHYLERRTLRQASDCPWLLVDRNSTSLRLRRRNSPSP